MARLKTAMRVGSTAPLVLGALALDPSVANALTCSEPQGTTLKCSDELLGDAYVSQSGDRVSAGYSNNGIAASADIAAIEVVCLVCEIDPGPVKGHPACISGFDPVVDDVIAQAIDVLRRAAS